MALEAEVAIANLNGSRSIPLEQFFSGPEQDVQRENVLQPGEVLTAVTLPASKPGWQGTYVKARERAAGDFPLVSVAVGFALSGEQIQHPRIVLGGVAPVPWRSVDAEAVFNASVAGCARP